jgi:hypothetical protein
MYKTIILAVFLYGCETWSLILKEKHTLRMFGNRELRRIFGPKSDEVSKWWAELLDEELCYLYFSPNIISVIKSRRMRSQGMWYEWEEEDRVEFTDRKARRKETTRKARAYMCG